MNTAMKTPITVADHKEAEICAKGTIYLVDDEPKLLQALSDILCFEGYAVRQFGSAADYLAFLREELPRFAGPRCVVSDVNMPDITGLDLQHEIDGYEDIPLIMMSGLGRPEHVVSAFRQGALHFLIKPIDADELIETVQEALALSGEIAARQQTTDDLACRVAQLTDREKDVVRMVASGLLNKQIADQLGIALRTVKLYRQRALEKLNMNRAVELVRLLEDGLI